MSLQITYNGIDLENFLPEVRKEKVTHKSYIHIFPKTEIAQTEKKIKKQVYQLKDLYGNTKQLAQDIAKAIANELTPQEEEATTDLKNIELTDEEKNLLWKKGYKERHEYLIQKILIRSFEKTRNPETAFKNGLAEIKEYCQKLVELSQRTRVIKRRKKPTSVEIESAQEMDIEKIEAIQPRIIPTKTKRKLSLVELPEKQISKRLLLESPAKQLLSAFNEISANKKTLHSFIEKRYPNLDLKNLSEEKYNTIVQDFHTLYSNIESILPFMSLQQQNRCLEIVNKELSYEKIEIELFELLREAAKTHFTTPPAQDEPYKPFLPLVEKIFPRSALLSSYFQLFDSLYEKYHDMDKFCDIEFQKIQRTGCAKKKFTEFVQKQFSDLCNSPFGPENLKKARQELGRLLFVIDNEPENISRYIQHPDYKALRLYINFIPIFKNRVMEIATFEVLITHHLASALIRSDGTINSFLIQDLKSLLKSQIRKTHISLTNHINKILNEIENNENILRLLSDSQYNERVAQIGNFLQDQSSNTEGVHLVRAACQIAPTDQINLSHINKAIVSALLSPWRQYYFGSCHTTGPLIAMKSTSTEAVIKDFQDVIVHGSLSRQINDKQTDFYAPFSLYPVLLENLYLKDFEEAELCQRLFDEPSLQLAWELMLQKSRDTLKNFIKKFVQKHDDFKDNPFTLQDIVQEMRPNSMNEENFKLILKYINSRYQNPLLQCWQNGVMGMHHRPLDMPTSLSDLAFLEWKIMLMNTLNFFATKFKVDNLQFLISTTISNSKFLAKSLVPLLQNKVDFLEGKEKIDAKMQNLFDKSPTLKSLRFVSIPPQTKEQTQAEGGGKPLLQLAILDKQNRLKLITDKKEFCDVIIKVFCEVSKKALSPYDLNEADKITVEMMDDYSKSQKELKKELEKELGGQVKKLKIEEEEKIDTNSAWSFNDYIITSPASLRSPLFSIYFHTSKKIEMQKIVSKKDFKNGVCLFRDWVREMTQKGLLGSEKKLKIPADISNHFFNAILNDHILTGPDSSTEWREEKEKHLISFLKEAKGKTLQTIIEKAIKFLKTNEIKDRDIKTYKKVFQQRKSETLWDWYARVGKKFKKDDSSKWVEELEATIFEEIVALNPNLKKELIFKCGDSNHTTSDSTSGKICNVYYAFAFMPSFQGTPKWTTIGMCGNSITSMLLEDFEIQKDPDYFVKQHKTQSLLMPKGYFALPIQRLQNEFVQLWIRQTDKDNSVDQRPKLISLKARFQNAVNKLRHDNKLEFSDELFVTMYKTPDTPQGAIEVLLEKDNEKIEKLEIAT